MVHNRREEKGKRRKCPSAPIRGHQTLYRQMIDYVWAVFLRGSGLRHARRLLSASLLLLSRWGCTQRFYYGLNKHLHTSSAQTETVNFSNCGFIRPVHRYIHFTPLVSADREGGPSNTTLGPAPGVALIKILLWGAVTVATLMLSADSLLPWQNEPLGKIRKEI